MFCFFPYKLMRIIFDWLTRGVKPSSHAKPSSSDHRPYTLTYPKGMTNPMGRRTQVNNPTPIPTTHLLRVSHGTPLGSTHMSIHGNYLGVITKDPTAQSNLLYMGRCSQVSWDPSLYKEIPSYQGIQVSSPPLYKQQTITHLRYVNSLYLLHSWVLRDSSITDLTIGKFLAGTPPVLFDWFFSFVLQVHPLTRVWTINSLTIFVHHHKILNFFM